MPRSVAGAQLGQGLGPGELALGHGQVLHVEEGLGRAAPGPLHHLALPTEGAQQVRAAPLFGVHARASKDLVGLLPGEPPGSTLPQCPVEGAPRRLYIGLAESQAGPVPSLPARHPG